MYVLQLHHQINIPEINKWNYFSHIEFFKFSTALGCGSFSEKTLKKALVPS